MKKTILFDIGANNGNKWYRNLVEDQENTYVYMFEPTPYLCEVIKQSYSHLKNWTLIEKAVSNYEGSSRFNIAGHRDWGCSSLFNFREDIKFTGPEDRTDFNFTEVIDVEVITLNTFIKNNPQITHISYLHIDAQGSDLNVLKGSSNFLNIVEKGQIEAANSAPLYNESPSYQECINWLQNNNFNAEALNLSHECDIIFTRK